jgi:hypothetical protein
VPKRLLCGLLPQCLVDAYVFWQNADDSLIGYPAPDDDDEGKAITNANVNLEGLSVLRVKILKFGKDADHKGLGHAAAVGLVVRVPLLPAVSVDKAWTLQSRR